MIILRLYALLSTILPLSVLAQDFQNQYPNAFEPDSYDWQVQSRGTNATILRLKDTRKDGIIFERNNVLVSRHLKATAPGKSFDGLLVPGSHRITLDYEHPWTAEGTDHFLEQIIKANLSSLSSWTIDTTGYGQHMGNMSLLADTIRLLPNVTSVRWETKHPIPPIILNTLEMHHPKARLHYIMPYQWYEDTNNCSSSEGERLGYHNINDTCRASASAHIINSTLLYSLTVELDYSYDSDDSFMDLILHVLTSSPNIRELDISIHSTGCMPSSARFNFNFDKFPGKLPPLEVLRLEEYELGSILESKINSRSHEDRNPPWPLNKLPTGLLTGKFGQRVRHVLGYYNTDDTTIPDKTVDATKTNLDKWLHRMDWSNIHTLSLRWPSNYTLSTLWKQVPSLRNLTIQNTDDETPETAILSFIANTTLPLYSLSLEDTSIRPSHLVPILGETHKTLHSLTYLHQSSAYPQVYLGTTWTDFTGIMPDSSFVSAADLTSLFDSLPDLQRLTFDIRTGSEWDYTILDTLASRPNLKSLGLRFTAETPAHVGMPDRSQTSVDRLKEKELEVIIAGLKQYLRNKKVGSQFEELNIWVGWNKYGSVV